MERSEAGSRLRIPGEQGIWILIFGDLSMFALFFLTFAHYKHGYAELFSRSHRLLAGSGGLLNTMLLLFSSFLVASGVANAREHRRLPWEPFAGAVACGAGFAAIKVTDYHQVIVAGADPSTNDFFMLYFVLTGIHLVHLVLGTGLLTGITLHFRGRRLVDADMRVIECGTSFWHLVDVLWIVLFALFYVIP